MTNVVAPPPSPEEEKPRGAVLDTITKYWLPFLTALLVLATTVLGLYTKQTVARKQEIEEGSADLEHENARLKAQVAGLQQQLDDLQTTTTTRPRTPGTVPPTDAEVRRQTGAPTALNSFYGLDLDSLAPDWDVDTFAYGFYLDPSEISTNGEMVLVAEPPTYEECRTQTGVRSRIPTDQITTGQHLCVHTDGDRWAYVHIAAFDPAAVTMSIDIVVWKAPTDP